MTHAAPAHPPAVASMRDAGTLDSAAIAGVLATFLGGDDERIARLLSLST